MSLKSWGFYMLAFMAVMLVVSVAYEVGKWLLGWVGVVLP